MPDLKAIAAARGFDIPPDDLDRLTPVWEQLDDELRKVLTVLPDGPDCAIQFQLLEQEQ
jgi:hypothetical protein